MPRGKHSHQKSTAAYVVDVNMGYGHSRAAHNVADLCNGKVISANDYPGIPQKDQSLWEHSRRWYERISRLKPIPLIGNTAFSLFDRFQRISDFYPRRDLSKPNVQLRQIYHLMKKGLGRDLVDRLSAEPKPLVTTFFIPAFFAEYYDYPGEIYAVTTDADISRAWAPLHPQESRIKYFASNGRVKERLMLYGVPEKNIFLTGFPLPKSLIGGAQSTLLHAHLLQRLCNLDPCGHFIDRYKKTLTNHFGTDVCLEPTSDHPLTITYSVGGAGAQKRLGADIMSSLREKVKRHHVRLNMVAGVNKSIANYFRKQAIDLGLQRYLGKTLFIQTFRSRRSYFEGFDTILKTTDILWTKPSELSFYTALGIAVLIAPPIGSQEEFNRVWLQYVGGGVSQLNPKFVHEWLFDWLQSGGIAKMAWNGYIEAPTHGVYRIEDIVLGRPSELHPLPLIV